MPIRLTLTSPTRRSAASPRSRAGFSLVEIIVACAILTLGIAVVVPALAFNVKSNAVAKNKGAAIFIAEKHMEKILSWQPYETIGSSKGVVSDNDELFGDLGDQTLNGIASHFNVKAEMYDNDNCTPAVKFGGSGSFNDSGLNTGDISTEGCTSGARGEDLKVVRVIVTWDDKFGSHSIERHGYVTRN